MSGSSVQCRANGLPTLGLGRELLDEDDFREPEPGEERAQRLPARVPGPFQKGLVRVHFRLERIAGALEELRGLRGVEVRSDDLHLRGPQLYLRLDPGKDHLDAAAGDAQRFDVELAQVDAEVSDGEDDGPPAGRPDRGAGP